MRRYRNKPKLELLETRVLLSAVDAPSDFTAENNWNGAIHGTGQVAVDLLPYNEVLKISGSGHGNVEIDLSHLPASVINLQISSFDSVTLIGQHEVSNFTVTNVRNVDAGHLSISNTLAARNVEHVKIDEAPTLVLLQGDGAWGTLGDKTLFEANDFSNATIFSYLKNLGVMSSKSAIDHLSIFSGDPTATILLNFQPDRKQLDIAGIDEQGKQVNYIRGDFTRYFLASSAERSALEQSSVVARLAANASFVSASTLFNKPAIQAALGAIIDNSSATTVHLRTTGDTDFATHSGALTPVQPEGGDAKAIRRDIALFADEPGKFVATRTPEAVTEKTAGTPSVDASHAIAPDFVAFTAASHGDAGAALQPIEILSLALSRLANPFVQTVSDLQGRLSTFGDIVTVQVAAQMRTDGRPALLVDARNHARERDMQEITVVNV